MRKEIFGIFSIFLLLVVSISLFSFHPDDPSPFHPGQNLPVHNLFGWIGAQLSGFLFGMSGKGVLWIPFVLVTALIPIFQKKSWLISARILLGGILLILTTSGFLTIFDPGMSTGRLYAAPGGIIGTHATVFLLYYTGLPGTLIVLTVLGLTGLVLATGITLKTFGWLAGRFSLGKARSWNHMEDISLKTSSIESKSTANPIKTKSKTSRPKETPSSVVPTIRETVILPDGPPENASLGQKSRETASWKEGNGFVLPGPEFLDSPEIRPVTEDNEHLVEQSRLLENKLSDFGVKGKVTAITPGPVITTFEYEPAPGVKITRVVNLSDDLALALKAFSIRIVAPIPGKSVIGIEIPNPIRQIVHFQEIVTSVVFEKSKSPLTLCLGKDIVGRPVVTELDRMPHLLIAGATGTGKSVGLNAMICSLLYKSLPDQVKMIMIDPKRIELSLYDGIPHLITPVVTDVKKATNALFWAVKEMEQRYELLSEYKCRNIGQFNQKILKLKPDMENPLPEKLPFIVIVIDELADLMMVASRDVEVALTRLAQMARASGIHLILATQRPSVDVLTGIIKANFPTRLTFQVSSRTDSRTIIDSNGAESLLGNGDMLLLPPGTAKLQRIHGAFISEEEVGRITEFLKQQKPPEYIEEVTETLEEASEDGEPKAHDERYDDAVALVTRTRQASISMVQRHLRIGYNRAARIIEMMEKEGVVGPSDGVKPREVLVRGYDE